MVSLPQLATRKDACDDYATFAAAAARAVAAAHADGDDLDEARGAQIAFNDIADLARALPLPGEGRAQARFCALAAVAGVDVTLGRLFEAHADALAILAELDGPQAAPGQRWGVWAAEGPQATVTATPTDAGYRLTGSKPWCSGAALCTHALLTAAGADGPGLYAVALEPASARPQAGSWQAVGLAGSSTEAVLFSDAPATPIGEPGEYLSRPGFWHGGIGVAAVWWGAAAGIARPLYAAARVGDRGTDPYKLAHLGAIECQLTAGAALLREAAATIDAAPLEAGEQLALTARATVESAAQQVIERVGRALGPAPLCHDRAHARRVADLMVYVRQTHAERDLARIGTLTGSDRPRGGR